MTATVIMSVLSTVLCIHTHSPCRQEDGDTAQLLNTSLAEGLAFDRTENFSAMTAIFTVLVVFVVLVIFGLAWVIFTMDPAKDTVVYRLMPGRVKTE